MSKAADRLNKLRTGNRLFNLGMGVEISENFSKRCSVVFQVRRGREYFGLKMHTLFILYHFIYSGAKQDVTLTFEVIADLLC